MFTAAFDAIAGEEISRLVENRAQERRTLEYKSELPGNSDADKREFLSDVASFATGSGGYIAFGVEDERDDDGNSTGIPKRICGLGKLNTDNAILRLESVCRDGLDPRVQGLQTKAILDLDEGPVILLRIPKSLFGPHRVSYRGSSRFYSRNSAGKYPMDTAELKTAFAAAEELPERIRRWREHRLALVAENNTPIVLSGTARLVLHVIHARAFDSGMGVDFMRVSPTDLRPIHATGWNHRVNFDGFLTYDSPEPSARAYVQLFRNGALEAVDIGVLPHDSERGVIPTQLFEREIILCLTQYLATLTTLGVEPPIYVMLSLLGVKGFVLGIRNAFPDELVPMDRDVLAMPEAVVEELGTPADRVLRSAFDAIWNAGNRRGSPYYDANGRWVGVP